MNISIGSDDKEKEMSLDGKETCQYEVDGLASAIKQVKVAEKKRPELYAKAMEQLMEEAEAITDMASLRKKAKKVIAKETGIGDSDD